MATAAEKKLKQAQDLLKQAQKVSATGQSLRTDIFNQFQAGQAERDFLRTLNPEEAVLPDMPDQAAMDAAEAAAADAKAFLASGGKTVTPKKTLQSTYTDPASGDIIDVYDNGDGTTSETVRKKGTVALDKAEADRIAAADKARQGKSAYDLLNAQFKQYGLSSLVEPLKKLITGGASVAEMTIELRNTPDYQKRFAANKQRIAAGLTALDEADYIAMEDQYQNIMRNYGLPADYYAKDEMGTQAGFTTLIAGDVSALELEDRIATAQKRVINANPEVTSALKQFYPDITNGDILAYTLNPAKGLEDIKRKVTAAEIGGAAVRSGLTTNVSDAEYLQSYGVTKQIADQGYSTIAGGLQRGSQLASMYGEDPYTQAVAETEVFNVPGAQEARKQRQKITGLEKATFGGQSGISQGALTRDRAGGY
jgi:hypothetical protein